MTGLPVEITTTGSTFSPKVALAAGSTGTVTWACPSASITTTGLTPTLSFGSAATRTVYMTVADANGYEAIDQVEVFNLGYNYASDDPGVYSPSSSYNWTSQAVSAVTGIHYMTGLKLFFASGIASLTGHLDFTGLDQLTNIELYGSFVDSVTLAGCVSLVRLVLEANNLTSIDLNPVAPNLFEFRAARQGGGALTFYPPVLFEFGELIHFCVHDEVITGIPNAVTGMPNLQQYWIGNSGQSGTLTVDSLDLTSVTAFSNQYTSMTISGAPANLTEIVMNECSLTSVDFSSVPVLAGSIDLSDNALPQAQVDAVLAACDAGGATGGTLKLTGNAAPSSTGISHATSLTGKSWTVSYGSTGVSVVQSAHAGGGQPLNFSSNVTAGNTVILIAGAYTGSGSAMSSSNAKLNGSTVTGTYAVFNPGGSNGLVSPFQGSHGVYLCAWVLPNCPAANGLTVTLTNGTQTGIVALEVSGLGSSPSLGAYNNQVAASGLLADSGLGYSSSGALGKGLSIGMAQMWNTSSAGPAAPWTNIQADPATWIGYRPYSGGSGGAVRWAQNVNYGGGDPWCAGSFIVTS